MFGVPSLCKNLVKTSFRQEAVATFRWRPPREAGHPPNLHRSNQAKQGLFHGKDIRTGNSISHSHAKSKRDWKPNVQNKRLWSDALNRWIRFKITTAGIKAVDHYGGIDNYILALDDRLVEDSNYVTKMRREISAALYFKGELPDKLIKHLGYDKVPPTKPMEEETVAQ